MNVLGEELRRIFLRFPDFEALHPAFDGAVSDGDESLGLAEHWLEHCHHARNAFFCLARNVCGHKDCHGILLLSERTRKRTAPYLQKYAHVLCNNAQRGLGRPAGLSRGCARGTYLDRRTTP